MRNLKTQYQESPPEVEGDINISIQRQEWVKKNINEETAKLLLDDELYFLHQSLSTPCLNAISASEGIFLKDLQGRQIMDFHGNSVHQVGHGNERVVEAIIKQLKELPFCPRRYTNRVAVDLAKCLSELAPGNLNKLLFAPGGTNAIGMALKLARYVTGNYKTISMWDSFHGASLDAISIGGESLFRKDLGPLMPGAIHVPPPSRHNCHFNCTNDEHINCIKYLEYIIEMEGDIGAIIAEPMRWTTLEMPPENYWKKIREICDRLGILLIFDEIPSALGRTGKMFVCEHFDVIPDMLVIGKGLGGGIFPMAALIAREDLDIVGDVALGHYTHEKSSVGCAAGMATIQCILEDGLIEKAVHLGKYAMERLTKMKSKFSIIHGVRGFGLYFGIELRNGGKPAYVEAEKVLYHSLERGLSYKIGGGCVITLCPPMTIGLNELDKALDILEEGITSIS